MEVPPQTKGLIEECYESLSEQDLDRFVATFTEDAEMHDLPEMPETEPYLGREGVRRWAENMLQLADAWEWRLEEIVATNGDVIVGLAHVTIQGHGSGLTVELDVFHVTELREGKLAKVYGFTEREAAMEAAGLN